MLLMVCKEAQDILIPARVTAIGESRRSDMAILNGPVEEPLYSRNQPVA